MMRHVSSTPSWRVKRVALAVHRRVEQHLVRRGALAALVREQHVEVDLLGVHAVGLVRFELELDARRRVEAHHELVRVGVGVAQLEAEARRLFEHEPQLGLRDGQELAGADEERHAGPAPVVDVEPQRRVGLGRGVGGDAVDVAVAVVLAAHVVRGVGRGDRAEQPQSARP